MKFHAWATHALATRARELGAACSVVLLSLANSGCGGANAQTPVFEVSSPDLASGTFSSRFILNGVGCTGNNVSPQIAWRNAPGGTQSFALQVVDLDGPEGRQFWHWAVYNIPASADGLAQGAGNSPATLPSPAFGGTSDLLDTGLTNGNGNYGGPCPTAGESPHRYQFTLYALAVPDVQAAAGLPRTGTPGLYNLVINRVIGSALLGTASFTATFGR